MTIRAALLAAAVLAAPAAAPAAETVVSHGISAFGDLKYPAGFTNFDYVNPDAPRGGTFSSVGSGASRTYDSLNPFILKGEPAQGIELTLDTLMVPSADEPDAVYGLVAETVEYPEDRSWAVFTLRPEARFSDGTPVTAADVVYSLEAIRTDGSPRMKILFGDIEAAEALGPDRVRFTFREAAPKRDLPALVGAGLPVLSRDWFATRDFAESSLEPMLGSGPYRVGEVKPGRQIVYERREDYWARDLPVNRGRYNFDRVVYEYFKDSTAAFEAFKAGAYLFHEEFFSKLWATAYDFPALQKGWVKRESIPDGRPSGAQGYWFNLRREKFADPRVREALALAFDFEWSNETLFYGLYKRTTSFFQGSPMAASGPPSDAEMALLEPVAEYLPDTVFETAYTPPATDGSGRNRANLRRAGALLDAAGWAVVDGMRRNAAGETLSVEFIDDNPAFERITNPYVQSLRKLGVDASTRTIDAAQYQQRLENFDYDVTVARFSMSATPGVELRAFFSSASADQPSSFNLSGVRNPAIDALVEAAIGARTRAELTTAVGALDRSLRALQIWVPQWSKGTHTIAYWDQFGRPDPATKPPYSRAVIDTWWVDAARAAALAAARAE